ncbi:tRNA 4-thiouridine(8) synthase ThiI [Methanocella sp. CWC-04]|uniref:Probable tRNA sulfurtransferase n=1 Tax=Methanooceanicella nereidis TaxID=2052831 RepID=A0AAP2W417_9EURY|nr:tRNA uracil 4-sulfurtransferase ThiI [Methanocella sp. CWC-04]MCD1293760.1 tRNA 4-thiouridine(8) synthase ThiI [Methanocella sp. CWC-04]
MEDLKYDTVMVRYGELAIKSEQVRNKYEKILIKNIEAMLDLHKIEYQEIVRERGRIYVISEDKRAPAVISNVFGVVSTSPVITTGPTLEESCKVAAAIGKEVIKDGESFAINARRAGAHDFTSQDAGRKCGDAVWEAIKDRHPRVDLKNPDHEIFVEIREERSYIFTGVIRGTGGMPLGSQGKMVALVSGGIDSPVAAWMMMRRGCEIIPVYFNNEQYVDEAYTQKAIDTIRKLKEWSPGHDFKVYEVPHGECLRTFRERGNIRYTCVFCKRMMYKVAIEIAKKEGAHGIITGSSLGQVASQTSENLLIEHHGIDFPIYHPLIGLDKNEIVDMAQRIGTLDISVRPAMGCQAVPKHPAIHGRIEEIMKMESEQVDFDKMIGDALSRARITIM